MLVITRKLGEEIVIGDPRTPIGTIKVVRIDGDRIRLGLTFPELPIHRREIADEIAAPRIEYVPGGRKRKF